jgi:hypothetical protein
MNRIGGEDRRWERERKEKWRRMKRSILRRSQVLK